MSNTPSDLFSAIGMAPALPGARCRGRSHLFDPPERGEDPDTTDYRHRHALALCRGCTALASCTAWFDTLTPRKRPQGVTAGRIHLVKPRPRREVNP